MTFEHVHPLQTPPRPPQDLPCPPPLCPFFVSSGSNTYVDAWSSTGACLTYHVLSPFLASDNHGPNYQGVLLATNLDFSFLAILGVSHSHSSCCHQP